MMEENDIEIEVEPFKYNQQQDKIIQIGMAGEYFIYEYLKQKYGDKVSWINDKNDSRSADYARSYVVLPPQYGESFLLQDHFRHLG